VSGQRIRFHITGIVQGVGFRPFVWQLATRYCLTGSVHNHSSGVTIEVESADAMALAEFRTALWQEAPPLAVIDTVTEEPIPPVGDRSFTIEHSHAEAARSTPVSPDVAICEACLRELLAPADRRYHYPFINCTNCGPRFTIIEDLPYDRPQTTMRHFPMCQACQAEYDDPADRRFHAQPNACPACGPRVWFVDDVAADPGDFVRPTDEKESSEGAIHRFHEAIIAGKIIAVKGIGGFHLACDATSDAAVAELRRRKGRVDKPLALMLRCLDECHKYVQVSDRAARILQSKERPIVLLPQRAATSDAPLSPLVAPGNDYLGIMLPYSPLHYLLLADGPPLVMTSANITDEPIVKDNLEARDRLASLADCFLLHNRDIQVVCDDSVVRYVDTQLLPIRRSRGYAPMPLRLNAPVPSVLAVGGELKGTFCVTKDEYAYVSQHIGDMGNLETIEALQRNCEHLTRLLRAEPVQIVADYHPEYLSTRWAIAQSRQKDLPLVQVQHHFAHAAALAAEHRLTSEASLLCVVFDGTGYGLDGAIWGGELLLLGAGQWERLSHLDYVPLPGGDASIRHPYRTALSHLHAASVDWQDALPCVQACPTTERGILAKQFQSNFRCVPTSSMGRLFDAVASLCGIRQSVSYEAQAAMEMEALAAGVLESAASRAKRSRYRFELLDEGKFCAAAVVQAIAEDVRAGAPCAQVAADFHRAVVQLIVDLVRWAQVRRSFDHVGLSGGVFQNALLLEMMIDALTRARYVPLVHRLVPPNDGGLALGQAVAATVFSKSAGVVRPAEL
jgi:hydrogenase maturation protein HypF